LRRSLAIELCRQLIAAGAVVSVHDPAAEPLPPDLASQVIRPASAEAALTAADAAVLATEWPVYRELDPAAMLAAMARPLLLDQGRFLADRLAADNRFQYVTVGTPL
jgi:UDPglucose 6-dehydrogenase